MQPVGSHRNDHNAAVQAKGAKSYATTLKANTHPHFGAPKHVFIFFLCFALLSGTASGNEKSSCELSRRGAHDAATSVALLMAGRSSLRFQRSMCITLHRGSFPIPTPPIYVQPRSLLRVARRIGHLPVLRVFIFYIFFGRLLH